MTKEIIVVPPQVADVKALPLISDLQFLEIATSEALNRKMLGVVNDGIRRGFNHKIGTGLKMTMGDASGKNTACVERGGVLLTIQGQHPVEVTLPAGKESAIVIEGFYQYGVKTKQVDANSEIDGAKILVVDSNKTLDHHVILCDVNVPLGATQITEPMISIVRRKAAGLDIQSHVDHTDPHVQYVKKTFQIKTALPLKGGKDLNGQDLTLSIDTATTARTGTVQLIDSYTNTSAVLAPTSNALRAANQRAVDKENAIQSDLNSHKSNMANPHKVTKAQVGLGSVPNYPATSAVNDASDAKFATASAVKLAYDKALAVETAVNGSVTAHINNKSNPHAVTKAQVGLGSVPNYAISDAYNSNGTNLATRTAVFNSYTALTNSINTKISTTDANDKFLDSATYLTSRRLTDANSATGKGVRVDHLNTNALNRPNGLANTDCALLTCNYDASNYSTQIATDWYASSMFVRCKSSGTWKAWAQVYTTAFKPNKTDVGLSAVNNWGATTAVNSTSTTTYATASAVKQAYDLAASKITKSQGDSYYLAKTAQANSSKANFGAYSTSGAVNGIAPETGGFQYHYNIAMNSTGCFPTSNNANGVLTFNAHSGEYYQQLGFSSNGNMYHRPNRTGSWGQIYTSLSKPSKTDVGLDSVNNWGATTAVNSTSTTTYATASAVKLAYDKALAVETAVNGSVTAHINNKSNPHTVTKAQIGLGRVKDVGLNWAWGSANPTHIWGSQGDAGESYVYNGTQLKAFIGLSAVNNWGATTAVNSTSTTTYATASAVKQAYDLAASKANAATLANMFPVGHVLLTVNAANPTSYGYVGTWTMLDADLSLVSTKSSSEVNKITGTNTPTVPVSSHSHTASSGGATLDKRFNTNTTGDHNHISYVWLGNTGPTQNAGQGTYSNQWTQERPTSNSGNHSHYTDVNFGSHGHSVTVNAAGTANATIDVRGRHLRVYMWMRTK